MSFCLTVKIYYLRSDDDRSSTEATYGIAKFFVVKLCIIYLSSIVMI